jgi:ribonuclease J
MYSWIKPQIAVPVHGEPMHLSAHADLARELGVETVVEIKDGIMTRLAPAPVREVDQIDVSRLYKDGRLIADLDGVGIPDRRKLSFAGHVAVSIVIDRKGEQAADPDIALTGLPAKDAENRPFEETVMNAIMGTIDSLPRPQKRDPDVLGEAVRRAVRAAVAEAWGKKPICTVFVAVV